MTLLADAPTGLEALAPPAVHVTGALDSIALPRVRADLDDALRSRPGCVLVDLTACSHVDASALAMLLDVHRRMARYGGRLVLCGASARIVRVLSLTGLRRVFELA